MKLRLSVIIATLGLAGALVAKELTAGRAADEALAAQMCATFARWSAPNVDLIRRRAAGLSAFASGRLSRLRQGGLDTSGLQPGSIAHGLLSAPTDDDAKDLLFEQAFGLASATVERSGVDPSADSATLRLAAGRLYKIQCAELQAALDSASRSMKPDR